MRTVLVLAAVSLVVAGSACGPAAGTALTVVLEEQLPDGGKPERLEPLNAAAVTVVAPDARVFPSVEGAPLLDVELEDNAGARTHLVIQDGAGDGHVELAAGTALALTTSPPCCIGPQITSALLVDDQGLVAGGFESGGMATVDGTGLTLAAAGARSLPAFNACGSENAIAVTFAGDDSVTLASGEAGAVTANGVQVAVRNAGSEHLDRHCTDGIAGDVVSWVGVRASLR